MDDAAICSLVARLSRPHQSGGRVVERAAILAEGADSTEVLAWITAHDGVPEELPPQSTGGGLHGARRHGSGDADLRTPLRFVLPSDAIS